MSTTVLTLIAVACLVLYLMRRRARLSADDDDELTLLFSSRVSACTFAEPEPNCTTDRLS